MRETEADSTTGRNGAAADVTTPGQSQDVKAQIELTDRHLQALSEKLTSESVCRRLGIALGLESHKIQTINSDNKQDITSSAFKMLLAWFQNQEDEITAWNELDQALIKAELKLYRKCLRL